MENSSNMNKEQLLEVVNSLEKSCGETNNNTSSVEPDNNTIKHSDNYGDLATKPNLTSDDNKIKCSHCGGKHDAETKFCPTTGKRMPKKLPNLRACSNEQCSEFGLYNQPERVNFCSQCGRKLSLSYNGHEIVDLGLSVKWAKYNMAKVDKGEYKGEWGDGWRLPTIEEFGELFKKEHYYERFESNILKIETSKKSEGCIMLDGGTYRTSSGLFYVKINVLSASYKKGIELIEVTTESSKVNIRLVIDLEK